MSTSPRKELTILYNLQFVTGDQVIVTGGQYSGQIGKVDVAIGCMTKYGLYAKVWVMLAERNATAFRPEDLLLVNPTEA
jgi:ribosomal protein S4E